MSTKRKFTPEELRNLKATSYTLWATKGHISYTLAFRRSSEISVSRAILEQQRFENWIVTLRLLSLNGFTILRNEFEEIPNLVELH